MRSTLRRAAPFLVLLLASLLLGSGPAVAVTPTPTPTLTPTVTPTPLTVSANAVYTLCSVSSANSVCGRLRKAASQSTTAAYLFQVSAEGAKFDIWVSCDNASGGASRSFRKRIQFKGETLSIPASDVGPCTLGVTPTWSSGTSVLLASITGDHTMLVLPTPGP